MGRWGLGFWVRVLGLRLGVRVRVGALGLESGPYIPVCVFRGIHIHDATTPGTRGGLGGQGLKVKLLGLGLGLDVLG